MGTTCKSALCLRRQMRDSNIGHTRPQGWCVVQVLEKGDNIPMHNKIFQTQLLYPSQ